MATQVDVIKSLVQSLISAGKSGTTGDAALTSFLNTYGLSNYAALKTKFVDALSGYSSAQTFLEQVCGIRVNNTDTGAITGSDAGGSTTKTSDSIIPESTAAVELTEAEYSSFTKNGLTVNVTYNDSLYTDASYNAGSKFNNDVDVYLAKQRLVVRALYNWWIPEAADLIKESLGIDLSAGNSNLSTINIKFSNKSSDAALTVRTNSDMGLASTATLTINMYKLASITENDLNGSMSNDETTYTYDYSSISLPKGDGSGYNSTYYNGWTSRFDRLMLMGLTELALRANIPYYYNLPSEVQDGLRKLTNGFDDGGVISSSSYSASANGVAASTQDGYTLLRFLARNYAGIEYNDDGTAVTVTSDYVHSSIPSNYVSYDSNVVTITGAGRTNPLNISGNESPNVIVGTSGADTINGKVGNDTLTGGAGNDVFVYTAGEGNDVITDYTAGELISIVGSNFNSSVNGNDVILYMSTETGTINLKDAIGKAININDSFTLIQGGATDENLTGTAKADYIYGGAGNDVINGNAGVDYLVGEAGDDTLTGGAGADIFRYKSGDGNDVITDYAAGQDIIYLASGSITKSSLSGNDVVLTVGTGTITVKNAKGQQITVADSAGNLTSKVYSDTTPSTTLTVSNTTASPVTVGSAIKTIDASKRTTAVKIQGNTLANSIVGGSGADSLSGLAGADTLNGGKGNDTLTGGAGNDVFFYKSGEGNDVITDYAVGDKIKITDAKISKTSVSGSDVVLTVGSGTIKVKNGKGKSLSIYNNANSVTTTVIGGSSTSTTSGGTSTTTLKSGLSYSTDKKTLTAKAPFTGTIDLSKYASTVTTVNASTDTKFISINGTSRAETIKAGKGGSILTGGKGSDKLYGGSGADTFVYANGDGKDTIYNYTSYIDTIKISKGTISKASVSGSDVVLTVGSGSITIQNAKGKDINITDSTGETKSYNFTKTVTSPTTSSNYEERWFIEDDNNFNSSDVSSILPTNSNITSDYSLSNELKLTQSNDITSLTYSQTKKK